MNSLAAFNVGLVSGAYTDCFLFSLPFLTCCWPSVSTVYLVKYWSELYVRTYVCVSLGSKLVAV
jgi:hypothetical protein